MSNVTFDVIARDRASATFRKVGVETQTLGSKLKTLVAGAGLATLGYEALRFGKDSVKAFTDAQTAQAKLADAFKRFPALTDVTIGSLRDLNMALEAKTGADHNALASGEAVLAGFKLTGDQIAQIIPLVDDYAAKTGQDIPTAATGVGRALLGNTRALKSIGIEFKATGNTAQDFTTITGLLQAKLGGFATREGKTAAGQLKILQAQFRDVEEELGSALLPALVDLGHFLLRDVIPPIKSTAEFLKDNKDVVKPLAEAIGIAIAAWKTYTAVTGLAADANVTFGATATATTAKVATETAVLRRGMSLRGLALGAGALVAGQQVGGKSGGILSAAGQGALIGSTLGPEGAFAGAVLGAGIKTASGFTGTHLPSQAALNAQAATVQGRKEIEAFAQEGNKIPLVGDKLQSMAKAALKAADAQNKVGGATAGATSKLREQVKALVSAQSKALDLSTGQDSLREAIHNMAVVAAGQSSRALKGNSDAALANRDALRGAVSQAESYIQTLKQQGIHGDKLYGTEKRLAAAIHRNAVETYGNKTAVDKLLSSLGLMPGEIQAIIDKYNQLHHVYFTASNLAQSLKALGPGLPGYDPGKQKQAGQNAGSSFSGGYSSTVVPGVAAASTAAANAASSIFDKLRSKEQADVQTITGYFKQTQQQFVSTFSTFQTSGTDILGGSGLNANFHAQLKQGATQMHTFAHLWHRLNDLGLDPRLLAQFTGPDYIPAMREILQSGRKGIRSDDRLERQIARDARGIAQTSTDDRYGRLLHHDFETFPRKLSREMVKDLHHAKFVVEFDSGKHDRNNGRKSRQHR